MTALKQFQRLEALGLWREFDQDQRIEVVLSFGETTLLLSDMRNNPLTHWSLPAIEPIEKSERGIIYSADPEGEETLEIHDPLMIDALNKIRHDISASRPHPGRLRGYLSLGLIALVMAIVVFWLPSKIFRYAADIMPDEKARLVGEELVLSIQRSTGQVCESTTGIQALAALSERLKLPEVSTLRVVELGQKPIIRLPGHLTLINANLLRDVDDPAIAAGYVLSGYSDQDDHNGNLDLFKSIGLRKTLNFLTTGEIDSGMLDAYANELLFRGEEQASVKDLQISFAIAEVPMTPFAIHAKRDDLLIDGELVGGQGPILRDDQMVSLQSICLG